jgi:hypothetical protein
LKGILLFNQGDLGKAYLTNDDISIISKKDFVEGNSNVDYNKRKKNTPMYIYSTSLYYICTSSVDARCFKLIVVNML